jgi:hypothetical protein
VPYLLGFGAFSAAAVDAQSTFDIISGVEDKILEIFGAAIATPDKTEKVESLSGPVELPKDAPAVSIPTTFPMSRLAAFVMKAFQTNVDHRRSSGVDTRLRKALLAQTCSFTAEQKEKMRRAGISEDLYAPITAVKIRAAKAMLVDIFQAAGDWPFALYPTPDPEVPAQVEEEALESVRQDIDKIYDGLRNAGLQQIPENAQQILDAIIFNAFNARYDNIQHRKEEFARTRAKRMEKKIQDYFTEGGFIDAFQEYVNYICVYGTGLILGPIPRVMPMNECHTDKKSGAVKYQRVYRKIPTYEAVNPMDCYPAPDAKTVDDGPLCIRIKYTANELWQYTTNVKSKQSTEKADGWLVHTVRALLDRYPHGGCKIDCEPFDPVRRLQEKNGSDNQEDCTLEGIRCFASVRGSDLIEFGVTKNRDGRNIEFTKFYQVETIVIGGFVVYCRILDDRIGRPVCKGVFYELPGSWWGESIADKVAMCQNVMNNAIKALMQNMAAASGPMYWINDVTRYTDKDGTGLKVRPHKMWAFQTSMMGNSGAPMGIIDVPSNATELLGVWERMKTQADDDSGIPAYTYGQSSGNSGAMRTAQGLAIFTEAASRGMKMVIGTTDRLVTRALVKKTADYILLYDDNLELKGDCEVRPAGVMGKILRAQQDQQRLQLFNMVVGNQFLLQMVGPKGVIALLRPSIQDVNINPDDVLPSEERVRELEQIQLVMQMAQAANAQAQAQGQQQQNAMAAQNAQMQQQQTAGAPPGVSQPPSVGGGVAERRSAA